MKVAAATTATSVAWWALSSCNVLWIIIARCFDSAPGLVSSRAWLWGLWKDPFEFS